MSNQDVEQGLNELPDQVAAALEAWKTKTLECEKCEALLYLEFRAINDGKTATDIKAMVNASEIRFQAVLSELQSEAAYTRLYEKLMSVKKLASLRTAY